MSRDGAAAFGGSGGPIVIGEKCPPDDKGRGGAKASSMKGGGVGGTICCPLIPGDIRGTEFLELPLFLQRLLIPLTEMIDPARSARVALRCWPSSEVAESAENRLETRIGGVTGLVTSGDFLGSDSVTSLRSVFTL